MGKGKGGLTWEKPKHMPSIFVMHGAWRCLFFFSAFLGFMISFPVYSVLNDTLNDTKRFTMALPGVPAYFPFRVHELCYMMFLICTQGQNERLGDFP